MYELPGDDEVGRVVVELDSVFGRTAPAVFPRSADSSRPRRLLISPGCGGTAVTGPVDWPPVDDYQGALRFLGRFVNLEASAGRIHGLSLDAMRGFVGAMGDPQHDRQDAPRHRNQRQGFGLGNGLGPLGSRRPPGGWLHQPPRGHRARAPRHRWPDPYRRMRSRTWLADLERYAEVVATVPSYFELLTAAAFLWFSNEAVDAAVVEVGCWAASTPRTCVIRRCRSSPTSVGTTRTVRGTGDAT